MTDMPQMVALYNGMGGGSAAAIAAVELLRMPSAVTVGAADRHGVDRRAHRRDLASGSLIAWAKLDGRIDKTWRMRGQQVVNGSAVLATLALSALHRDLRARPRGSAHRRAFFVGALIFGVLMTLPIGGADMPVVISLYNAFTGLAVGFEGYVLENPALIIAGMVVGSAGTLLTQLMAQGDEPQRRQRAVQQLRRHGRRAAGEINGTHEADRRGRRRVMMAVEGDHRARLRHGGRAGAAQGLGVRASCWSNAASTVKFAIHPVAGRMPGHMNVLLAEAGVPYDLISDLDDINAEFKTADVALVIGANDVVNPAARTDKSSPIYGMPILNVDQAKHVNVIKRGQGTGYSGVENELFFADNCNMVYGDAQKVMVAMIQAVKSLEGGH